MRIFFHVPKVFCLFIFVCLCGDVQAQSQLKHKEDPVLLYAENFNSYEDGALPSGWWVEGGESVYIEDGHLMVKADPERKKGPGYAATVWNKKRFAGDIQVKFDAHVVSSTLHVNNINFFLYYSHSGADSTLYGSRNFRLDGMYTHYHDLNGYIFTFVHTHHAGKDGARFRMRRCPGFELINEKYAYHDRRGKSYRIKITKRGHELTYAVDGTVYLKKKDLKYNWTKGLLGFRTFHTVVWFDNLKVTRI